MTHLLAFAAGITTGLALSLLWKPRRVAARWVEPEDGVQPVDPRTMALADYPNFGEQWAANGGQLPPGVRYVETSLGWTFVR